MNLPPGIGFITGNNNSILFYLHAFFCLPPFVFAVLENFLYDLIKLKAENSEFEATTPVHGSPSGYQER